MGAAGAQQLLQAWVSNDLGWARSSTRNNLACGPAPNTVRLMDEAGFRSIVRAAGAATLEQRTTLYGTGRHCTMISLRRVLRLARASFRRPAKAGSAARLYTVGPHREAAHPWPPLRVSLFRAWNARHQAGERRGAVAASWAAGGRCSMQIAHPMVAQRGVAEPQRLRTRSIRGGWWPTLKRHGPRWFSSATRSSPQRAVASMHAGARARGRRTATTPMIPYCCSGWYAHPDRTTALDGPRSLPCGPPGHGRSEQFLRRVAAGRRPASALPRSIQPPTLSPVSTSTWVGWSTNPRCSADGTPRRLGPARWLPPAGGQRCWPPAAEPLAARLPPAHRRPCCPGPPARGIWACAGDRSRKVALEALQAWLAGSTLPPTSPAPLRRRRPPTIPH